MPWMARLRIPEYSAGYSGGDKAPLWTRRAVPPEDVVRGEGNDGGGAKARQSASSIQTRRPKQRANAFLPEVNAGLIELVQ